MTRPEVVEVREIPLGDGRAVRIALLDGALLIAVGHGEGSSWREDPAPTTAKVPCRRAKNVLRWFRQSFRREGGHFDHLSPAGAVPSSPDCTEARSTSSAGPGRGCASDGFGGAFR